MSGSIWNHLQGVEFRQTWIPAGKVRTRVVEAGSGPPLIFLHGTGGHAEAYFKNIAAHARHFHVYAMDMVGHGYSDTPAIDYAMQDYVDFMLAFLDGIGAERAFISGESLGASVAAWFAIQHPGRVHKIVLNTGTLLPPDDQGRAELNDLLERSRQATGTPDREAIRRRMRWLMLRSEDLTDEIVEVRWRIYQQPGRPAVLRRSVEQSLGALLEPALQRRWYTPDLLRQITCPALILWTRHNPGQGVPLAEESAKLIPHSRLVVLENSAHWPQWEEPEMFDKVHLEYLRQ